MFAKKLNIIVVFNPLNLDEGYGDSQIATPNDGTVALQARSFILPYVHGSTNAILEGVFAFRSYERVSVGDSIQFSFPVNGQLGQDQGNVLQMMPDDSNFSDASEVPIVFDTGVYKLVDSSLTPLVDEFACCM